MCRRTFEIDARGTYRSFDRGAGADRGDAPVLNHERSVFDGALASPLISRAPS
jgi:hypothetical protein